ncbi:MAG: YheV family putative zinc ribbon protein [Pontibacterium sp.]
MTIIKRFIAGATCPRCGEQDTLKMYRDDEREHRECVRCDFADSMRLDGQPDAPQELETRVNQPRQAPAKQTQAQALNFVPNPGLKRKDH